MANLDLRHIAAPMINQSDLPFRALAHAHGATLSFTQMLHPAQLLADRDYLAFHRRNLELGKAADLDGRVVVQLCGNDPEAVVRGARTVVDVCDGIGAPFQKYPDLNLGCPQEVAREGHFGAYLLHPKDWPLVESMVSSLAKSLPVPVSAKLRLCSPSSATLTLAQELEAAGASFVTLHARHVSARRRRQGPADLSVVKALVEGLSVPVVSNGNVRTWADVEENLGYTGAEGVMVGETLLGNPYLFEDKLPDPIRISLEYLALCRAYPGTASIVTIQTHVRHFIAFQCERRPWFHKFRSALAQCASIDDIEALLKGRVRRWRGEASEGLKAELGAEDGEGEAADDDTHDDLDLSLDDHIVE
ncbi:FMN-linked oxidoreductase [Amylostereum chailletii]|nr:FMN-linked oxidoreductase [Amylostereum chailletii]